MAEQEKIYDLDSDSFVDNPALKTPAAAAEPAKEEVAKEEEEEETEVEEPEGKKEEPAKEEESEEEEGEESEEEEEEEEEEEPETSNDKEEAVTPDAYVEATYGEKWGVKTEADLTKLVENSINIVDEHEKLKKDYDALKVDAGKIKFESEAEESAFKFIKTFDPNMQGEALNTYAKLIAMDVDKVDGKLLMEEAYIHRHSELTREEAIKKFNREYQRKYSPKKEDFESDEAYDEEMEMLKLDIKSDVAKDRSFLKEKQKEFKPKAVEDKSKVSEPVMKSIEKHASESTTFIDKTNELTFDHDGDKYTFKLDAEKKKRISETVNAWVKNPSSYDKDGNLIGVKGHDEMLKIAAGGMFMDDIIKAIAGQVKNSANIKRVDEIAKSKPKARKSPGGGDIMGDDLDAQAAHIIKNRKAA